MMTEEAFQKYDFIHRAKADFQLYNLIAEHKDWEETAEDDDSSETE